MKTIGVVILAVLIVAVTSRIPRYHRKLSDGRGMFLFIGIDFFFFFIYQWTSTLLSLPLTKENLIENHGKVVCTLMVKRNFPSESERV